mgnify:CR=1 FL=1
MIFQPISLLKTSGEMGLPREISKTRLEKGKMDIAIIH